MTTVTPELRDEPTDDDLTTELAMLREATRAYIARELPLRALRPLLDDPVGHDPAWHRRAAAQGWFAFFDPAGELDGHAVQVACVLAEELGRAMQPGPFLPVNLVIAAVARWGNDEQRSAVLPGLVAGELVATWADTVTTGRRERPAVVARTVGDELVVDGEVPLVQDALQADWFLVSALVDGRPNMLLVPKDTVGLMVEARTSFDLLRRLSVVTFGGARLPTSTHLGAPAPPSDAPNHLLDLAIVLQSAETLGVIGALLDMTVEYAKNRIAFGRPIGSFQALKHIMADLALYLETARAGVLAAAQLLDAGESEGTEAASIVKAYVSDVAIDVAQESLQIHGGIGYTWEHDLHLYLRRVSGNAALHGTAGWHRERLCRLRGIDGMNDA